MKYPILCIVGSALLTAMPSITTAQPSAPNKNVQQTQPHKHQPTQNKAPAQNQQQATRPTTQQPYGRWDKSWGSRPPAPPKHWTKKGDWHRHVRVCQQKFRSYNARTDTYRTTSGKTLRCPL